MPKQGDEDSQDVRKRLLILGLGVVLVGLIGGGIAMAVSGGSAKPEVRVATTTTTVSPTTTTTDSPPTTNATGSTSTTIASSSPTSSTTPPAYESSQFVLSVTTSETAYEQGQEVQITGTVRNVGQACELVKGSCPYTFTVSDASGNLIWNSSFGRDCTSNLIAGPIPADWTDSQMTSWNQEECPSPSQASTNGTGCSGPQAPAGTYSLGATWQAVVASPKRITIS